MKKFFSRVLIFFLLPVFTLIGVVVFTATYKKRGLSGRYLIELNDMLNFLYEEWCYTLEAVNG